MDIYTLGKYIIDNLEGGYYHPAMKPYLPNGDKMLDSGETMFGMDRTGGSDIVNSEDGKDFWNLIDANYYTHHADRAYYNDMADGKRIAKSVGDELRRLATNMMKNRFDRYSKSLLPGVYNLVINDPRLLLQFLYACWNGVGNFNTFAQVANNTYNSGKKDVGSIYNAINATRRNMPGATAQKKELFAKGANKIDLICDKYLGGVPTKKNNSKIFWIIFAAIAGVTFYQLVKK